MKLSNPNSMLSSRCCSATFLHPIEGRLGELDGVLGAAQRGLWIADEGVAGAKLFLERAGGCPSHRPIDGNTALVAINALLLKRIKLAGIKRAKPMAAASNVPVFAVAAA